MQTLRNRFVYRHRPLDGTAQPFRVTPEDGSGDTLTGTLHRPTAPKPLPLIFLLHGLTGSEDSMYMLESTRHHLAQGHTILRMNLRGAGTSQKLCSTLYSGGSWPDVLTVLSALDPALTAHGVVLIGYSMGGNILLNALPHLPQDSPCLGAVTVSAPIDPMSASLRLMQRRNWIYQDALLKEMKQTYLDLPYADDPATRRAIKDADSIYTFDDTLTAPLHGFFDAPTYYARTAGQAKLPDIKTPLLLVHAEDDPWIPVAPYHALRTPDHITVHITRSGGHVGFHGRGHPQPWHDLRASEFIASLDA